MKRGIFKNKFVYFFIVLSCAVLYFTPVLFGCGPYFDSAIFTYSAHPDIPFDKYVQGELGVLQPNYARSYLVVGYRYLSGNELNLAEQQAVLKLWDHRLKDIYTSDENKDNWESKWAATRKKVIKDDQTAIDPTKTESTPERYLSYTNCTDDAFRTAVETLENKLAKSTANNPELLDWLKAQDQVFKNCSGGPAIPPPASAASSSQHKADRAYQIAAANFYSSNFDTAEKLFLDIAKDNGSPWRQLAPYLAARAIVRKATVPAEDNKIDTATLARAEAKLKIILTDKSATSVYPASQRLLNYVNLRLHPKDMIHQLAGELVKKGNGQTLQQDLYDYTFLLDKFADEEDFGSQPAKPVKKELQTLRSNDELTDWVLTFQSSDEASLDYSIQKWEKTTSSAWLVAAMTKVKMYHPKLPELMEAANKIMPGSPAYISIAYHQMRLLFETGKRDEAREKLTTILAKPAAMPVSALNLFLALRMKLARNLDEFIKYAQRVPTTTSTSEDGRELPDEFYNTEAEKKAPKPLPILFDVDSAMVMNDRLPLSILKQIALNTKLPANLHRRVILGVWIRAILLDNEAVAKELKPELEKAVPELKEFLAAYIADQDPEARKFAAHYLILKFPGTRPYIESNLMRQEELGKIDSYRDNWWCSFDPKDKVVSAEGESENPKPVEFPLEFLNEAQIKAAKAEQQKLYQLGTAPNYLSSQVVKWGKTNLQDPRLPETLYLAIRSTRYGCVDKGTLAFSKAAFQLLHKEFPNNEWTKKTPYFFGEQ